MPPRCKNGSSMATSTESQSKEAGTASRTLQLRASTSSSGKSRPGATSDLCPAALGQQVRPSRDLEKMRGAKGGNLPGALGRGRPMDGAQGEASVGLGAPRRVSRSKGCRLSGPRSVAASALGGWRASLLSPAAPSQGARPIEEPDVATEP